MNFMAALTRYKRLSVEQRRVFSSRAITGKRSLRYWTRFIRQLSEFDALRDKSAKALAWLTVLGAIMLLVSGSYLFVDYYEWTLENYIGVGVALLSLSGFIWLLRTAYFLSSNDLPNHLRAVVYPFLKVLMVETSPRAKVDLTVRLRERIDMHHLTAPPRKLDPKKNSRWIKATETRYSRTWLLLEALLADCTRMQLSVEDSTRKLDVTKRGSSGKIRSKLKYKIRTKIRAAFLPPGATQWVRYKTVIPTSEPDSIIALDQLLSVISRYYKEHPPKRAKQAVTT